MAQPIVNHLKNYYLNPNIIVVATSRYHDIASMLKCAVALDQPVIFIENKQMGAHLNDYPIMVGLISLQYGKL